LEIKSDLTLILVRVKQERHRKNLQYESICFSYLIHNSDRFYAKLFIISNFDNIFRESKNHFYVLSRVTNSSKYQSVSIGVSVFSFTQFLRERVEYL